MTQIAALTVFVRGLTLEAEIGIHPHERGRRQPLVVDVTLSLRPDPVRGLDDTVNYERIAARARALVEAGHVELVEQFAERLAESCLEDGRVVEARVRVEKPAILAGAAGAGCEIVRIR